MLKSFEKLKERIHTHRKQCKHFAEGEPCFNCHINTLTAIEQNLWDMELKN